MEGYYTYFLLMEKKGSLSVLDSSICSYFQKYRCSRQEETNCYGSNKKQIASFYDAMGQQFFRKNIKSQQETKRPVCQHKLKDKMVNKIKNPFRSALPREVSQEAQVCVNEVECSRVKFEPMFSEVCCRSKNNYVIDEEVRKMVTADIQQMMKKKEENHFQTYFPQGGQAKEDIKSKINTEKLIKTYNRIVSKYKNESNESHPTLKLQDLNTMIDHQDEPTFDHQLFDLLALFKKIYFSAHSEFITENLLKYILKFHKQDPFERKIGTAQPNPKNRPKIKSITSHSASHCKSLSKPDLPSEPKFLRASLMTPSNLKKSSEPKKKVQFRSSVGGGRISAMGQLQMKLRL